MSDDRLQYFWAGPLSQWQRSEFELDGVTFGTVEQAMMYHQALLFGDEQIAKRILSATEPSKQKALGRQVKRFNEKVWRKNREDIVYRVSFAKFDQNKGLRRTLFQTAGKQLVEASPVDTIWGIGVDARTARSMPPDLWPGKNLLGKILTKVRDEIMVKYPDHAAAIAKENNE